MVGMWYNCSQEGVSGGSNQGTLERRKGVHWKGATAECVVECAQQARWSAAKVYSPGVRLQGAFEGHIQEAQLGDVGE